VPARHDLYGMPGAEAFPHRLTTPHGAVLVEFPPSTYEVLGTRVPVGGGGYFRFYPYWLSRHLLRRINERFQRPFIFYVHPWEVDAEQPRVRAGWRSRFRHYVNLGKTQARLERLVRDFSFRPVRDVLRDLELMA
jgi:polysaccharide deacetylase family protein (PEP-CTERM system associated)